MAIISERMLTISQAVSADFEDVYPQLIQCFGSALTKEEWKKIFVSHWPSPEEFCGYKLLKDGVVKGYLGLLFSNRIIGGESVTFCNLTSWCVAEDCRVHGLRLLLEALKLRDYTLTNFTASPAAAEILRHFNFTEFSVDHRVLFPLPNLGTEDYVCEFDLLKIRDGLGDVEQTIFDDHQNLGCVHLLLRSSGGSSYLVLKKTKRKHFPFAKVHYLSNAENFVGCIDRAMMKICARLRVLGVMVDERYLRGHRLQRSFSYPHQRKGYFKSSLALDHDQIDTLYSELVVLHS